MSDFRPNLSMYSRAINDTGTPAPSYADTLKNAEGIKLSRLQNQAAQTKLSDDDSAKKKKIVHEAMESLAGMTPERRRAEYPKIQDGLIQSGALKPDQAVPELDESLFQRSWGAIQKSPEYIARQQESAKTGLMNAQAAAIGPDTERQRRLAEAQINHYNAQADKDRRDSKNPTKSLSPGEQKADEAFGKEASDYYYSGGKAAVEKNLQQLEGAIQKLNGDPDPETGKPRSSADLTGGFTTKLPFLASDDAQDIINPQMASVRDDIRGAIQGSLKQVLGGQYTEKEGQAIFNRAFNPRLSAQENIKRATAELDAIKRMAAAKDRSMSQFVSSGTLKGYRPSDTVMPVQREQYASGGQQQPGLGLTEANASNQTPMENQRKVGAKVGIKEIEEYAIKYKMKASDAKAHLKEQGYVVD